MPDFVAVRREHVFSALDEFDAAGEDAFMDRHGFTATRAPFLLVMEKAYPVKPILGVAHRYATGQAATWEQIPAGPQGAERWLDELGFEIVKPLKLTQAAPRVGVWRDAGPAPTAQAIRAWAEVAETALREAAITYRGTLAATELAEQVQWVTGIRASGLVPSWIGLVIAEVTRACLVADKPAVSALCVDRQGRVNSGYADGLTAAGLLGQSTEQHAAEQRLASYEAYSTDLPSEGATMEAVVASRAPSTRKAKAAAPKKPKAPSARPVSRAPAAQMIVPSKAACPNCYTEMPATGLCDYCD